jgi:hypothetical protein
MLIVANDFVKRQTQESRFSYFGGTWEELENLVIENWENAKPGYRTGVILIEVPGDNFHSSIVELQEGDKLVGEYTPRRKGEPPRKTLNTDSRRKTPAVAVDIVLYSSKTLAEDGDNNLPPVDGNWEIISINASIVLGDTPIHPMVLMHNHFGSIGGTTTHLSDSDFIGLLERSFRFWKDKATCT